jgi:hypothetical protein
MHEKNLINQDNAMVTLSLGLLATIAALGDKLVVANKTLAFITVTFVFLTILQVVIGYYLSNKYFISVKNKLSKNYSDSKQLDNGLQDILEGKINNFLNHTTYMTFFLSMIFFIIIILIYIGRI